MLAAADLVVAASAPLVEHVAERRPSVLIRNAADVGCWTITTGTGFQGRGPADA